MLKGHAHPLPIDPKKYQIDLSECSLMACMCAKCIWLMLLMYWLIFLGAFIGGIAQGLKKEDYVIN